MSWSYVRPHRCNIIFLKIAQNSKVKGQEEVISTNDFVSWKVDPNGDMINRLAKVLWSNEEEAGIQHEDGYVKKLTIFDCESNIMFSIRWRLLLH